MDSKLLRAYVYLEDGNFEEAKKCAKDILHADSHNAEAYLVLLMANIGVKKRTQLGTLQARFDSYDEYREIMKLDNKALQDELQCYLNEIDKNIAKIKLTQILVEKERQEKEREKQIEREKENASVQYEMLKREIEGINIRSYSIMDLSRLKKELESIERYVNVDELMRKVDKRLSPAAKVVSNVSSVLITIAWLAPIVLGIGGFIVGRFVLGSFLIGCFLGMIGGLIGFCVWMKTM